MEGEQVVKRQRPEPSRRSDPQVAVEALRRDVDPLLARLQLAGEAVVDEDRVGAGQPPPFAEVDRGADPGPARGPRPAPDTVPRGGRAGPASPPAPAVGAAAGSATAPRSIPPQVGPSSHRRQALRFASRASASPGARRTRSSPAAASHAEVVIVSPPAGAEAGRGCGSATRPSPASAAGSGGCRLPAPRSAAGRSGHSRPGRARGRS